MADDTSLEKTEPTPRRGAGAAAVSEGDGKVLSGKMVAYIGTADVREIDAAAWRNADVNDQKKVVWDTRKRGGSMIPVEEFSEAALVYLDEVDDGFIIMDAPVKTS